MSRDSKMSRFTFAVTDNTRHKSQTVRTFSTCTIPLVVCGVGLLGKRICRSDRMRRCFTVELCCFQQHHYLSIVYVVSMHCRTLIPATMPWALSSSTMVLPVEQDW